MPILTATDVSKDYGAGALRVPALRGVSLVVEAGELLAIMGPSGCGKSTLLHILGGIDIPTSGQVLLEGDELAAMNDTQRSIVRRRIGFVFQKINLLPTLSAAENVALPLRIDGVSRRHARARAEAVLAEVGLAARANHLPHQLSGGEQQRVAIARAHVVQPAVILTDEPTGALDSANAHQIFELLRAAAARGQTIVMVTHDAQLARQADRVIMMHDGRIIEPGLSDSLAEVLAQGGEDQP